MDSAFKPAAFPTMTTREIEALLERESRYPSMHRNLDHEAKLRAELERRAKAASGDESVMTQGERLRYLRTGKPR